MKLTKPAGVALQIAGGFLLVVGLNSAGNGALAVTVLCLPLGGWMLWQGGKPARRGGTDRHEV